MIVRLKNSSVIYKWRLYAEVSHYTIQAKFIVLTAIKQFVKQKVLGIEHFEKTRI
jgi:hypothetical protein